MVGGAVSQGGVASNPAFHSSTNPEMHAICQGDGTDCRGYPSIIKASGSYPTNGIDPLTSSRIRLSILASEANLESSNTPPWDSMRISVGTTTVRPTTQLITNAEENIDCKDETGANMVGGCTRFIFEVPEWTGLNQPITLWVATIKSNNAIIDFQAPTITAIYETGTTNRLQGIPTGGAAGGALGVNRKFDIVGTNFGSSNIPNPFQLHFQNIIEATCTETALTSVPVDADACSDVTTLSTSTACNQVMTAADPAIAACTYLETLKTPLLIQPR